MSTQCSDFNCDSLLLEGCDFQDYPTGGQLSFAKQMMSVFGNRLALVGISTDDTPTGQWIVKNIAGVPYLFFSFANVNPSPQKPLIPHRLYTSVQLMRYRKEILSLGMKNIFLQAPELLIIISRWSLNNICYMFPGVGNPLINSRYSMGKLIAPFFDCQLFKALKKAELILACAGSEEIAGLIKRSKGVLYRDQVVQFPTRVDIGLFQPSNKTKYRQNININPSSPPIFVTCGRISEGKGWKFLIDSLVCYKNKYGECKLIFVGDGEDRGKLEEYIKSAELGKDITITGFLGPANVAIYLNIADAALVGSIEEGWSIAMLEALACGTPIVTTKVSGAIEMIKEGFNGYIISDRAPENFSECMNKVIQLKTTSAEISVEIAEKYSLQSLADDLSALWNPLA